eukprot:TRINITY_DN12415_c0_g1_i2.p1 TRINITY_DN12415_c0_g1~~TRINITY_DN12415_c0_g1_i2.p1  ORF type:complete len:490 (+),score=145.74 TRINITY_DN12415_c0_g1_i2:57-1526(+)
MATDEAIAKWAKVDPMPPSSHIFAGELSVLVEHDDGPDPPEILYACKATLLTRSGKKRQSQAVVLVRRALVLCTMKEPPTVQRTVRLSKILMVTSRMGWKDGGAGVTTAVLVQVQDEKDILMEVRPQEADELVDRLRRQKYVEGRCPELLPHKRLSFVAPGDKQPRHQLAMLEQTDLGRLYCLRPLRLAHTSECHRRFWGRACDLPSQVEEGVGGPVDRKYVTIEWMPPNDAAHPGPPRYALEQNDSVAEWPHLTPGNVLELATKDFAGRECVRLCTKLDADSWAVVPVAGAGEDTLTKQRFDGARPLLKVVVRCPPFTSEPEWWWCGYGMAEPCTEDDGGRKMAVVQPGWLVEGERCGLCKAKDVQLQRLRRELRRYAFQAQREAVGESLEQIESRHAKLEQKNLALCEQLHDVMRLADQSRDLANGLSESINRLQTNYGKAILTTEWLKAGTPGWTAIDSKDLIAELAYKKERLQQVCDAPPVHGDP